ncbi:hypothetical protein GXP74_00855 [Streptacidiphilus sp. P02-A3a]|nr:hypothetical protein GXP74_00855 [Streptacidiphilus sp. P02-A3a]
MTSARRRGQTQQTSPLGRLGIGVLITLAGAGLVLYGLYQVGHATGLLGVRGTLTVSSCARVGTGKGSYIGCTGPFRADNGRTEDPAALVNENPPPAPGTELRVDQVHPGSYVRIDASRTEDWLAVTALGLTFLSAGIAAAKHRFAEGVTLDTRGSRSDRILAIIIVHCLLLAVLLGGAGLLTSTSGS